MLSIWKVKLEENGNRAFGAGDELKEKKDKNCRTRTQSTRIDQL
jgi:hypothetical protein